MKKLLIIFCIFWTTSVFSQNKSEIDSIATIKCMLKEVSYRQVITKKVPGNYCFITNRQYKKLMKLASNKEGEEKVSYADGFYPIKFIGLSNREITDFLVLGSGESGYLKTISVMLRSTQTNKIIDSHGLSLPRNKKLLFVKITYPIDCVINTMSREWRYTSTPRFESYVAAGGLLYWDFGMLKWKF